MSSVPQSSLDDRHRIIILWSVWQVGRVELSMVEDIVAVHNPVSEPALKPRNETLEDGRRGCWVNIALGFMSHEFREWTA